MSKIIVFGGNVFVGKALVNRLVSDGHEVYVLNRGNHPTPEGAHQITVDRNNPIELRKILLHHSFDVVYDGSAYKEKQTEFVLENFINSTKHFIHISSAAVYKKTTLFPLTEKHPRGLNDDWGDYSTQKYLCEELLFSAWEDNNFPVTIFRPMYIYGPNNILDRETYIFKRILQNKPIIIPGMGIPIIQFGHIEDLVDAMVGIMENPESFGRAYNISGKECITLKGWVEACAQVVGIEPEIHLVETHNVGCTARDWFPFRDIHLFCSSDRLKKDLNIEPKYSLIDGLKQAYASLPKEDLLKPIEPSEEELDLIKKTKK